MHLEELCADAPVRVPGMSARSPRRDTGPPTHRSLVKKLATFCLDRLLMYPVSRSSIIAASMNGTPVRPSHHRLATSSLSAKFGFTHSSTFGRASAGYVEIWLENPVASNNEEGLTAAYWYTTNWK